MIVYAYSGPAKLTAKSGRDVAGLNYRKQLTLFKEPPVKIKANYEFLRGQNQVAGVVTGGRRRLRIRESQGERVAADVLLYAEADLSFRFVTEANDAREV